MHGFLASGTAMAAAALLVASAGCGLMAPRTDTYVAPPVGLAYVNTRRDSGSYGKDTVQIHSRYTGESTWRGQSVRVFESSESTLYTTTGEWVAFIAIMKGDTPILTWDPPAAWERPLEVGRQWKRKFNLTIHAAKRTLAVEEAQKVEAYEDVTVPAGTFKAWRVSTVDNLGNENMQWYAPELGLFVKQSLKRTASHAAGAGTREIELASFQRPW